MRVYSNWKTGREGLRQGPPNGEVPSRGYGEVELADEATGAANALDALAGAIKSTSNEKRPFNEAPGGWNMPPITRGDLVVRAQRLAQRLRALPEDSTDDDLRTLLGSIPSRATWMQGQSLPQLNSGNAPVVVGSLEALFAHIEQALPPPKNLSWEDIEDSKLIPKKLARRIRSLEAAIESIEPRTTNLDATISTIENAHSAAESLPTDLQGLQEATQEVKKLASQAKDAGKKAEAAHTEISQKLGSIRKLEAEASKLLANVESAYSAATTVGLAAAFSERAKKLAISTSVWVLLLIAALSTAGALGFYRLQLIQSLLNRDVSSERLWLNFAMSIFIIAAPVWFAWIATKQIGQRFRLSEDYAFKASVARAYEGYRREAARLDPALEARLFASALERLEEPPLRFVEHQEHGSPYQELLASPGFQRALEKFPDLRQSLLRLVRPRPSETAAE